MKTTRFALMMAHGTPRGITTWATIQIVQQAYPRTVSLLTPGVPSVPGSVASSSPVTEAQGGRRGGKGMR